MIRLVLAVVLVTGCSQINADQLIFERRDGGSVDAPPLAPNFGSIYANILEPKCAELCHSGGINAAGNMDLLAGDPYAQLVNTPAAGSECGDGERVRIVPGDTARSLLYQKVLAKRQMTDAPCGDPMPQGASHAALSEVEIETIRQWIADGANH